MKRMNISAFMAEIAAITFTVSLIAALVLPPPAMAQQSKARQASNGVFEIISVGNDNVQFKVVAETKFYSLALVSGKQVFAGKRFANAEGTVKWANGAQMLSGSSMSMPAKFGAGAMTLPKGIVMTISGFDVPAGFEAKTIRITTEGAKEMYYDIQRQSWGQQ